MKLPKTVKAKATIPDIADRLGDTYKAAAEAADVQSKIKTQAADEIKKLAEKHGVEDGKQKIITGSTWIVGFTKSEKQNRIDPNLVRKHLPSVIQKQLFVESIDEAAFERLVLQGHISPAEALAVCVPVPNSERKAVYVRPVLAPKQ